MKLSNQDLTHIFLALTALLVVAHGMGAIVRRFRQPPVIGEIIGGILIGPTLFGWIAGPVIFTTVFPRPEDQPATSYLLAAVQQIGLALLMFCSGLEIRSSFSRHEKRTAAMITITGTLIPFFLGAVGISLFDPTPYMGPANDRTAFLIVFAIAVAVTSIPVISRIFMDLGIIESPLARVVLAAAVIEDIFLYVLLAIAISMVGGKEHEPFGLPRALGLHGSTKWGLLYHVGANVAFIAIALLSGPSLFRRLESFRYNILRKASPVAFLLLFLFTMVGVGLYLGITPMFGAFVAGMVAATSSGGDDRKNRETIKTFAFAFFVPIYFAMVGLRLDLTKSFDPMFFVVFFVAACGVKALSVYVGARWAKEPGPKALDMAVAMNARGGPGIVLATEAHKEGIINEVFYATLVLLAIITSMMAGVWLDHRRRQGAFR